MNKETAMKSPHHKPLSSSVGRVARGRSLPALMMSFTLIFFAGHAVAAGAGEIQPRDGTWSMKLTNHETQGCSPRIAKAAKSGLAKLAGENNEHEITFAKPFHPEPLMKHDSELKWEHTGSNRWATEIAQQGSEAMSMRMVLDVEVISPTRINEIGTYHIDLSPMFVKMMGGSAHCRSIGHYELTWLH